MERKYQVASAVRRALVMGALTAAGAAPALAQENLGEIVVTGSRIRSANLEATTPVTQVTAADVVTQGVTRIEDLVNQLPQAFAAQNVTVANGATGTATLNLRGLGSPRTLVLVDGRRLPYGGVTNSAADINTIPTQMVERVDILTGGASAVYGSDAVAGVVNFIMKKDFEGVEVTSQYNFYWHENDYGGPGEVKLRDVIEGRAATNPAEFALPDDSVTDGEGVELSVVMGVNSGDGRGNITAYAAVFDSKAGPAGRSRLLGLLAEPGTRWRSFTCGGSCTNATGRFTNFGIGGSGLTSLPLMTATPCVRSTSRYDQYNFGPLNHYQRPERRYNLGAMGHYEFSEHADVYTQLMFNDYESIAQIAPGGTFGETSVDQLRQSADARRTCCATIGCDAGGDCGQHAVPLFIGRRNVEGGGRQQSFANKTFRMVVGRPWRHQRRLGLRRVGAVLDRVRARNSTLNYFQIDRVARALDVDRRSGWAFRPASRCSTGTDPNCVPWNPFVPGGITQDQLDYLQVTGIQIGRINQEIYNGIITGDLGAYGIKSPMASDGIQVVFGAEYRRDYAGPQGRCAAGGRRSSPAQAAPRSASSGSTKVKELFFEARVPIAQDQAFAESLTFDTAYRYSDYGDGIQTDTYKFGLEWAPIADVRLRGSYQRAVRAANIVELFTAQGFNLFDAPGDPCGALTRQTSPNANRVERSACATGVPAGAVRLFGSRQPGGTVQLPAGRQPGPDAGGIGHDVLRSRVPAAVGSGSRGDGRLLRHPDRGHDLDLRCAEHAGRRATTSATPTACASHRSRSGHAARSGSATATWRTSTSTSARCRRRAMTSTCRTPGSRWAASAASRFNLTGTYLDELITPIRVSTSIRRPYDCVGFYSTVCGTPNPQWRHRFRTSWQTPWDLDLSLTWRYYHEVTGLTEPTTRCLHDQLDREHAG